MILFFVCLNFPQFDFSFTTLEKHSMNAPVLLYFLPDYVPKSNKIISNLRKISDLNSKNQSIIFALVNCSIKKQFCNRFAFKDYSSIITIYRKFYQIQKITDATTKEIQNIYEGSFANPSSFCKNFMLSTNATTKSTQFNYPTFVLGFNDESSCLELSKYKTLFPHISFFIRNVEVPKKTHHLKLSLCSNPSKCLTNFHFINEIEFIDEHLFDHFGNWSLSNVSSIKRRLVLIVYNDIVFPNLSSSNNNFPERSQFEPYIQSYKTYFLFGAMPFSFFSASVGQLRDLENTPFMLITNVKKTRFMIVDYTRLNKNQISDKLNSARQGFLELAMEYFFDSKYALQNGYNPKNMLQFAIAAFSVIGITGFLIIWRACYCIKMINHHKNRHTISI